MEPELLEPEPLTDPEVRMLQAEMRDAVRAFLLRTPQAQPASVACLIDGEPVSLVLYPSLQTVLLYSPTVCGSLYGITDSILLLGAAQHLHALLERAAGQSSDAPAIGFTAALDALRKIQGEHSHRLHTNVSGVPGEA
jgi:hypothetical protein